MRLTSRFAYFCTGTAAAAILAGCSGGGGSQGLPANGTVSTLSQSTRITGTLPLGIRASDIGTVHRTPFVNIAGVKAAQGNQTIVADVASATVLVWGGAGQLNAILFDGISANPEGLATDAAENLYVSNEAFGNVIVYKKPYTAIDLTLDDSGELPVGVAVSQTGVVGVANFLTTALTPGSVSLYAKGATSACATISNPNWVTYFFDAFDASGNLFVNGQNSSGQTLVGEISGGCSATSLVTLAVGNELSAPGGIQTHRGKIMIDDPMHQTIYTYAAPSNGSLGSPTAGTTLAGATNPVTFAIMEGGQNLWTAEYNAFSPMANKYVYSSGSFVKSIDDHFMPIAVAVNPASRP